MSKERAFDVVCVGAGIVGLATAMRLAQRYRIRVAVLEAEPRPARHQTGRNSGVIHSGLYYEPGSLKADNCVSGRRRLIEFCDRRAIPYEICGKLVIATKPEEILRLDALERRGKHNGVRIERVLGDRIQEFEPHARGLEALWVPDTGIVDYQEVSAGYGAELAEAGGELHLETRVEGIHARPSEIVVSTTQGEFRARHLISCAGLQCDRVARMAGLHPRSRIVPFRGDYFDLAERSRHLLTNLIYPVPDPRFPFLGVHLTRRLDGSVEAGPNAVLALHREGYGRRAFSLRDSFETLTYPGLWRLGRKYWRTAATEFLRAGSAQRFAAELQRFIPGITAADLAPGGCGIRAQALTADGRLLDDFEIDHAPNQLHVLNAPSPAATASLAIGDTLVDRAAESFGLDRS